MAQSKLPKVSAETLLHGSWYALEQCGRLLQSAKDLRKNGDHSTAAVLSMFGREELGRSVILRELAEKVKLGHSFNPNEVRKACENHVEKQKQGARSTTTLTEGPCQLDRALRERMMSPPGSETWKQATKITDQAMESKQKRQPHKRHEFREHALYVDLDETGTAWNRPLMLTRHECEKAIEEAINDYQCEKDQFRDEIIEDDFPEMAAARLSMEVQITLPNLI